jgi:hypothetical protein
MESGTWGRAGHSGHHQGDHEARRGRAHAITGMPHQLVVTVYLARSLIAL